MRTEDPRPEPQAVRFSRGLFRSRRSALVAALLYTAVLYATVTWVFYAYMTVFNRIGEDWVRLTLNGIYAGVGIGFLAFVHFRLPRRGKTYLATAAIGVIAAYTLSTLDVPANRIHFLQYAPLTILWLEVFRFWFRDWKLYLGSFLAVLVIGYGDELLQSWQPDRRFDPHDVFLNGLAAALTLAFIGLVIGAENYPTGGNLKSQVNLKSQISNPK